MLFIFQVQHHSAEHYDYIFLRGMNMKDTGKTIIRSAAALFLAGTLASGTVFAQESGQNITNGLTPQQFVRAEAEQMDVMNITPAFEQYALEQAVRSGYTFSYDTEKKHNPMTQDEYVKAEAAQTGVMNITPAFEHYAQEKAVQEGYTFSEDAAETHTPMTQAEYVKAEAGQMGVMNITPAFEQYAVEKAARTGYTFSY
jgi:hypothetical protein